MLNNNLQKGLSLIGVVVAVAILASTAIVVSRVVVETQRLASVSRDKFVAVSLAREGLELVRVIRDTNALDEDASTRWNDIICDGQQVTNFEIYEQRVFEWLDGRVGVTTPLGGNPDYEGDYQRTIRVECRDNFVERGFIRVISTVTWDNRGEDDNVVLIEQLYDWL